jgi:uncharacterized protein DUF6364
MDTKLTLSIEKGVISQAKQYAKKKGVSLSEMVENYFILLTKTSKSDDLQLSSTVKSLKGSFTAPENFDYKAILKEEKSKKFL